MPAPSDQRIPWWRTDLGAAERDALARAIRDRHVNQGPLCAELEERLAALLDVPVVVATTSGSVALLLSLLACDVGAGDEVVVPASTFIAPAHAALLLGAKVRLVDVLADAPLLDPAGLEAALSPRTKAVVAVDLDGRACDVDGIRGRIAGSGVRVVEDAAQSLCSRSGGRFLGTRADVGAFSLGLTKLITSGEGGFVATSDPGLAGRLRKLRNQGVTAIADNVFDGFGFNFRLTDLQAAVALVQLDRLEEKIAGVTRVHRFYVERLRGLRFLRVMEADLDGGEVPLWTEALCAQRDRVVRLLDERGVQAKAFHPPLDESPHLEAKGNFPNAARFARLGIVLPSGPDQPDADLDRVVAALHEIESEIEGSVEG